MAVTIHDIARKVGVNSSTVSRVLNGKASISDETKEKIHAAMQELDYHPNSVARSLASGLSGAIGVVVDAENSEAFSNLFFSRSLFAIERITQSEGCNVIIANNAKRGGRLSPVENLMLERKVDGLILPSSVIKPKLIEKMSELHFPYVVLGQPINATFASASWVDINNAQGSELAVMHLLERGYQRIAYLGGSSVAGFVKQRVKGYIHSLREGYTPVVLSTDGTSENACSVATDILLMHGTATPDAFICNDNMTAFGLIEAANILSIKVPEQLGIVTFDNYPLAAYTNPSLTAVDVDTDMLGEQAARLLFQRIRKSMNNQQMLLNTTLIIRKSTERV